MAGESSIEEYEEEDDSLSEWLWLRKILGFLESEEAEDMASVKRVRIK